MRGFFERRVPLGQFRMLTYSAYLFAKLWELCEDARNAPPAERSARWDRVQAQVGLACAFCEQTALDGGRYHLSWLRTALPEPPFHLTTRNQKGERPHTQLIDAKWVAANLSYLRDLDYLASKTAAAGKGQPHGGPKGGDDAGEAPEHPRRPRPPKPKGPQ